MIARLHGDPNQEKRKKKITTTSGGFVRCPATTVLITRKIVILVAIEKLALAIRYRNMVVTAAEATKVMIATNTLGRRLERNIAMGEAPSIDDILLRVPLPDSEQQSSSVITVRSKVAKKVAVAVV